MTQGKMHYLDRVREDAYVDIYSASGMAMNAYPLRLGRYGDASGGIADRSTSFILDSAIGDESVTNEEIINRAERMGADVVVPSDVIGDPDATTTATVEMFRLADEHDFDGDVFVPLQADESQSWCDHYDTLQTQLLWQGVDITDQMVGVGGIRDLSPVEQIQTVQRIRNHVGEGVWLHGLGLGATREWVVAVQRDPTLLDSLDTSSVAHDVSNGTVWGQELQRKENKLPRGKNSTAIQAMQMEQQLYLLNYLMGPYPRDSDVPTDPSDELATVLSCSA